jgi:hypothetical protein
MSAKQQWLLHTHLVGQRVSLLLVNLAALQSSQRLPLHSVLPANNEPPQSSSALPRTLAGPGRIFAICCLYPLISLSNLAMLSSICCWRVPICQHA